MGARYLHHPLEGEEKVYRGKKGCLKEDGSCVVPCNGGDGIAFGLVRVLFLRVERIG